MTPLQKSAVRRCLCRFPGIVLGYYLPIEGVPRTKMSVLGNADEVNKVLDDEALAEEELLNELENGEIPAHIREARLQEFKEQAQMMSDMNEKQHGQYTDLKEAQKFLDTTTSEKKCVVHFYHADFRRCAIVDTHLEKLASKYFETKFAKIDVDKSKFFVDKLKIRVLPAVLCFIDGIVVDRIIGFEELGNTDSFSTTVLEKRLGRSGVISYKDVDADKDSSIFGRRVLPNGDSDSDNDW